MANMAPVVNARGSLYVHPQGIVRRTTFHVLKMYSDMLAAHVMESIVESDTFTHQRRNIPALDAVVTCDEARKKLVMAMINRHPTDELTCEVLIADESTDWTAPATVLSGDSVDAFNDVDNPNRVVPKRHNLQCNKGKIVLSPHSVTLCEMPLS